MVSAHSKRRVVFVTYEYPPSAGGGVQRIAKLTRYLPEHGWEPVVVTAEPAWGRTTDATLAAEVVGVETVRLPVRSVASGLARALAPLKRILRRGASRPSAESSAQSAPVAAQGAGTRRIPLSTRISRWLLVPDDAVLWSRDAARAAERVGRETGAVAVVASGPPHSALLAGATAAQRLGVPLIADMRDAWSGNPSAFWPTGWHRRRSAVLEADVLSGASAVTCVSDPIAAEAREAGAGVVHLLPNGFDPEDLPSRPDRNDGPLRLGFMGQFYGLTDPEPVVRAIADAVTDGADITLDVVGPPSSRLDVLVAEAGIGARVTAHGYLDHDKALAVMAGVDLGLVIIADLPGAEAVYTGKLFEYLGMGLPVLVVGPLEGAAARLVVELKAGLAVEYRETERLALVLRGLQGAAQSGEDLIADVDRAGVERFDRRVQAAWFASLLDDVVRQGA